MRSRLCGAARRAKEARRGRGAIAPALAVTRVVTLALLFAAAACAPRGGGGPEGGEREREAARLAAVVAAAQAAGAPMRDPLALPPEVLAAAAKQIGLRGSVAERMRRLAAWLGDGRGNLAFRYDERRTVTAEVAWSDRLGDCLSYAHLFNALARSLGVPMRYVRYRAPRGYQERDGQLLVISHVASLYDLDRESVLVDLSGEERAELRSDYQRLGDDEAAALHVSNLAMAELGRGGPGTAAAAERWIRAMLARAPGLPDLHNNLGAVLLHQQRAAEALAVLRAAIARFPHHVPLYVNAALAARALGQPRLAEELAAQAEAPWTDPYVPFVRGAWLVENGRAAEGVAILRDVVARSPDSATFQAHLAMGLLAMEEAAAERAGMVVGATGTAAGPGATGTGARAPTAAASRPGAASRPAAVSPLHRQAVAAFERARLLDPRHPLLVPLARRLGLISPAEAR